MMSHFSKIKSYLIVKELCEEKSKPTLSTLNRVVYFIFFANIADPDNIKIVFSKFNYIPSTVAITMFHCSQEP
jgi:hypothetical protein